MGAELDRAGHVDDARRSRGERQSRNGSSATTGVPCADRRRRARPACRRQHDVLEAGVAVDVDARARACGCRSPPCACPGTLLRIWLVRPWPMKPAPTMPTRIGRPCCLAGLQCVVDDDHRVLLPLVCGPRQALILRLSSARSRRAAATPRPSATSPPTGSGHSSPSRGSSYSSPPSTLGRVELADLVAGLGVVLEHLVAVREALRHVERAVVVGASARPRRAGGRSGSPAAGRR